MHNEPPLFIGEAARLAGVTPKTLTNLFYRRQLDADRCPVVGGRRLVPRDYLAAIRAVIARRRQDTARTATARSQVRNERAG